MRKLVLALALTLLTAAPAVAYGPSSKARYTKLETMLIMMDQGCRSYADTATRFGCLLFVDEQRQLRRIDLLPPQALELIAIGRRMYGR